MNKTELILTIFLFGYFVLTSSVSSSSKHDWKLQTLDLVRFPLAQCLDGSPAGFWFQKGYGSGKNKFFVFHQGGAWCKSQEECVNRSSTHLGSSKSWKKEITCGRTLQDTCWIDEPNPGKPEKNPVTYNWNKVYVGYCDGSSFSGDVIAPQLVTLKNGSNHTLYYRGKFIRDALYETLLTEYGMNNATEIMLSGGSAGALTIYIHGNYLSEKILSHTKHLQQPPRVMLMMDGGIFLNVPSVLGEELYPAKFKQIYLLHNLSHSLDHNCLRHYHQTNEGWKCFYAQYMLPFIHKTKEIFIINSLMDKWSGAYIMGITTCQPGKGRKDCNGKVQQYIDNYRLQLINSPGIQSFLNTSFLKDEGGQGRNYGAWLFTQWYHTVMQQKSYWQEIKVKGYNLRDVFQAWYYRKESAPHIVVGEEWK